MRTPVNPELIDIKFCTSRYIGDCTMCAKIHNRLTWWELSDKSDMFYYYVLNCEYMVEDNETCVLTVQYTKENSSS